MSKKRTSEVEAYIEKIVTYMDDQNVQASEAVAKFPVSTLSRAARDELARHGAIQIAGAAASRDRFIVASASAGKGAAVQNVNGASSGSSSRTTGGITSKSCWDRLQAASDFYTLNCIPMQAADGTRKVLINFTVGDWEFLLEKSTTQSDAWSRRRDLSGTALDLLKRYKQKTAASLPKKAKEDLERRATEAFSNQTMEEQAA